jgi:hypothetical protein
MKYESPEVTAVTPAIDAIQAVKFNPQIPDGGRVEHASPAYEDWE